MYFNIYPHSTSPKSTTHSHSIYVLFVFLNSSPICTVQIFLLIAISLELGCQPEARSLKKTTLGSYQLLTAPPLRVECCAHLPSSCWILFFLELKQILCVLTQSVWVQMCNFPILSKTLLVIIATMFLQLFCSIFPLEERSLIELSHSELSVPQCFFLF